MPSARTLRSRLSFLKLGSESSGSVSKQSSLNPSQSSLLYASLLINTIPLQILIDTGASATCITKQALPRLPHVHVLDRRPCSFFLADGFFSLRVLGNVELSMQIATELISFSTLVTENLCADLVLGIDFLYLFAAKIDVDLCQFSIKQNGRRITLNVDQTLRSPFVPIRSVSTVLLPPKSTVDIFVSSPVSSLSSTLIPTSNFLEHPHHRRRSDLSLG